MATESNKLKETDMKNRMYYYVDSTDFDFDNILIDAKSNENILVL